MTPNIDFQILDRTLEVRKLAWLGMSVGVSGHKYGFIYVQLLLHPQSIIDRTSTLKNLWSKTNSKSPKRQLTHF